MVFSFCMPPSTVTICLSLAHDSRCRSYLSAADIILWKCRRATVGLIFGATIAWWLFEKSDLSFLTICCDVLLILILVQFLWVKISGLLNK
jgi:hypothetical protein